LPFSPPGSTSVGSEATKPASMFFPTKLFDQVGVVRAADDRGKFSGDELLDQLTRCHLLNGKDSPQTDQGKVFLTPKPEILEENVPKDATGDSPRLVGEHTSRHFPLIFVVRALTAHEYLFEGQPNRLRLWSAGLPKVIFIKASTDATKLSCRDAFLIAWRPNGSNRHADPAA